jgi:hypothetical protein
MEVGLAVVVEMALGVILKFADGQMLKVLVLLPNALDFPEAHFFIFSIFSCLFSVGSVTKLHAHNQGCTSRVPHCIG